MKSTLHRLTGFASMVTVICVIVAGSTTAPRAASKNVNLDSISSTGNNGNESIVDLTVLSSYPAKVKCKITNKTAGYAFSFRWPSAGPGGFSSALAAGKTTGVGTVWDWQTGQTIYSYTGSICDKDICFTPTAWPTTSPGTRGPFGVPGRSLTTTDITYSSASLTSSLITFFSPPQTQVSVTSSFGPTAVGFVYSNTYTNNTTESVDLSFDRVPAGCCADPAQLNCGDPAGCVNYLSDPTNCGGCGNTCSDPSRPLCVAGDCVPKCEEGLAQCEYTCVDLQNDRFNCGACGNVCGDTSICTQGMCVECRPPEGTVCDNRCVNIRKDDENCGGCGINCDFSCPSTGQGTCSQGNSCICSDGSSTEPIPDLPPTGTSYDPYIPPGVPAPAPECTFDGYRTTIAPGTSFTRWNCSAEPMLATEAVTSLTISSLSGTTTGTFIELVPSNTPIGAASLSPVSVAVTEPSGDGLIQPGETAKLKVSVNNVGPSPVSGVAATLSAPPFDANDPDGDGTADAVPDANLDGTADFVVSPMPNLGIGVAHSTYPPIGGYTYSGECPAYAPGQEPPAFITPPAATNITSFEVIVPIDHPGDVAREFHLAVSGDTNNDGTTDFNQVVPFALGFGNRCDPTLKEGKFDQVDGLYSPMAKLVPEEDPALYPDKPFQRGKSRPLKMRILCGGLNLRGSEVSTPKIVGLAREGDPTDYTTAAINDDTGTNDPNFRFNDRTQQWIYNLRTSSLPVGRYVMTIEVGEVKNYVTGFVLQ